MKRGDIRYWKENTKNKETEQKERPFKRVTQEGQTCKEGVDIGKGMRSVTTYKITFILTPL